MLLEEPVKKLVERHQQESKRKDSGGWSRETGDGGDER
jgi:hypothetical protein